MTQQLTVIQMLPALDSGGVERGTVEFGKYLVDHGHRSIVISAGGRMLEQLKDQGSEHIPWSVGNKSIMSVRYVAKVREFLQTVKPDILHVRSRLPAWIGYMAWKRLPEQDRPGLVTTVHGPYSVGRYSSVMMRGQKVIAVSQMIRDYILNNYRFVDPQSIEVIYRGVDVNEYVFGYQPSVAWKEAWYSQYPQMLDRQLLTLPARLTRWKGQLDFISIIESLITSGHPVHGIIVGGAHQRKKEYKEELLRRIDQLDLSSHITLVGHRSDLKEILAQSNIVFSLSNEPEAFGRTTIEALSLGKPVLGYDHGGVSEQLSNVFPDGLVPVGNIDKAVVKLKAWLNEPPVPRDHHPFTLETMCSSILKVYKELAVNGI